MHKAVTTEVAYNCPMLLWPKVPDDPAKILPPATKAEKQLS